ncbi:MAG TPA: glycosyltransferase, partial [Gammaproteobacteria bacterium]|nr:glycosyltransferase [Gammaproteobacteria bacterium]
IPAGDGLSKRLSHSVLEACSGGIHPAMLLLVASAVALMAWVVVLLLPWQPHRTRECLEPDPSADDDLGDVVVVIPARNEAAVIERTLVALGRQGVGLHVIVVDDQSEDGTAQICERLAAAPTQYPMSLQVIEGGPLPAGWAGKLWALQQGFESVDRPYTLLLDADIEVGPRMLPTLLSLARERQASLVSIMAQLHCENLWERLLAPPFVFFFKLLYPFALVNDSRRRTAAAAGGCMLVRTAALRDLGGFAAIRGALIDDCALAAVLKSNQATIWLGLSHSVKSSRGYHDLADFWSMVSRSAFTQLRYSLPLLVLVSVLILLVFVAPLAGIASGSSTAVLGCGAWLAMCLAYLPIVRFYRLPAAWALTLPLAGTLFLAMTWSSAANYWRGTRATWKNRAYEA